MSNLMNLQTLGVLESTIDRSYIIRTRVLMSNLMNLQTLGVLESTIDRSYIKQSKRDTTSTLQA